MRCPAPRFHGYDASVGYCNALKIESFIKPHFFPTHSFASNSVVLSFCKLDRRQFNLMNSVRLLDIGGSGVKTAAISGVDDAFRLKTLDFQPHKDPDWDNFADWCDSNGLLDCKMIGISCAGFVEAGRKVKLFRVGGWRADRWSKYLNTGRTAQGFFFSMMLKRTSWPMSIFLRTQ